jgi:hypothetical protein
MIALTSERCDTTYYRIRMFDDRALREIDPHRFTKREKVTVDGSFFRNIFLTAPPRNPHLPFSIKRRTKRRTPPPVRRTPRKGCGWLQEWQSRRRSVALLNQPMEGFLLPEIQQQTLAIEKWMFATASSRNVLPSQSRGANLGDEQENTNTQSVKVARRLR